HCILAESRSCADNKRDRNLIAFPSSVSGAAACPVSFRVASNKTRAPDPKSDSPRIRLQLGTSQGRLSVLSYWISAPDVLDVQPRGSRGSHRRCTSEHARQADRRWLNTRMAKKLELQESWQLSQTAWSHHALSATFFCGDQWRPMRTTGQMGELMEWTRILAYISGTMDQELLLRNEYLAAENQILRGQLTGRPKLSDAERAKLGEIGRRLGRKALGDVATAALPDTILGWYRRLVARKFDGSKHRSPGRPRVDRAIEELIVRMAEENRSWGYDRIVRALANLGFEVSDQTVGNVLRRHGVSPAPSASARPHGRPSFEPTWRCWRGPTFSRRRC